MSRTVVNKRAFRFGDFLGSVEGQVWRVERSTTPFLVLPIPSASSAVKISLTNCQIRVESQIASREPALMAPVSAS